MDSLYLVPEMDIVNGTPTTDLEIVSVFKSPPLLNSNDSFLQFNDIFNMSLGRKFQIVYKAQKDSKISNQLYL